MRTYGLVDIVALPSLSTTAAVALGQEMLTVARAKADQLPGLVSTRLRALEVAYGKLHEALSQNQQLEPEPQRARQADLVEDQAWSAFHDWLAGWSKVTGVQANIARTLYAVLFPTRLKFTRLPFKLEWAEADARLARIASDGFGELIASLGGTPILEQVREAHRVYGEALGITAEAQAATVAGLREPLGDFRTRLRAYVLAVAAHANQDDPESQALTDSLLAPLQKWQSRHAGPASAGENDGAGGSGESGGSGASGELGDGAAGIAGVASGELAAPRASGFAASAVGRDEEAV